MTVVATNKLIQALGNPLRLEVVRLLAMEGPQSVNDLAARSNRAQHSMSKHLQIMRKAGVIVMVPGTDGDGRKLFHGLPPGSVREGAQGKEIDFGGCVVRLGVK
ncbi:MAG TPA: helix-turn-helix domain-containing protein [Verrucomicrobiae bacterium]